MFEGQRVVVVMPAYNAERTLETTYREVPRTIVDQVILVDDASSDRTVEVARRLGIGLVVHPENRGYGANQKTCYRLALESGAEVIVMLHPDYQYSPRLIGPMVALVVSGEYDLVLGSRILGTVARRGEMPWWRYVGNRFLTLVQNLLAGAKLSEYHTGYRAYSRKVLETIPLLENSDDFLFDNQVLLQALRFGFRIGEISCPAKYHPEASSIDFRRSVVYGLGVLGCSLQYAGWRFGVGHPTFLDPAGRTLSEAARQRGSATRPHRRGLDCAPPVGPV